MKKKVTSFHCFLLHEDDKLNKIVVIGNSASGKSTLSMKIKDITSIPVYHLDKILWKTGWERTPEDEFTQKHDQILRKSRWIIDGVAYKSTIKKRFEAADIIVFLDTPLEICKERALQRMKEDLIRPNPYVTDGCKYPIELVDEQNKTIELFHNEYRSFVRNLAEKFVTNKPVFFLSADEEVTSFLNFIKKKSS